MSTQQLSAIADDSIGEGPTGNTWRMTWAVVRNYPFSIYETTPHERQMIRCRKCHPDSCAFRAHQAAVVIRKAIVLKKQQQKTEGQTENMETRLKQTRGASVERYMQWGGARLRN